MTAEVNAKKYLQLNDIEAYKLSFHLSNKVWDIILTWNTLAQNTVGQQFIRAVDSISANIAEGFGRYSKKDKVRFYRIAYSSVLECLDWNEKSRARKLISEDLYKVLFIDFKKLPLVINSLIKFTNEKLKD